MMPQFSPEAQFRMAFRAVSADMSPSPCRW
jgi:hypothetical protein